MRLSESVQRRFWSRWCLDAATGCWIWTGQRSKHGGYGKLAVKGVGHVRAHRLAYELFIAPIPEGLQINHHCDEACCVNPAHLYVGTQRENMWDKLRRGRVPVGSRSGEGNGRATLSETDVRAIFDDERRQADIAADYGVDRSTVNAIKRGRRWGYLIAQILRERADLDQGDGWGRG